MHELHLFETERVKRLLERLGRESDVVVVDTPPLPEVAEAVAFADASEAVVLCVRIGHTRRDKLAELRDLLGRRGVAPLGFFVTGRRRPRTERQARLRGISRRPARDSGRLPPLAGGAAVAVLERALIPP